MNIDSISNRYTTGHGSGQRVLILQQRNYQLISWLLLGWYLFQYQAGITGFWLSTLQQDPVYKQITGFILFCYILSQWRIVLRYRKSRISAGARLKQHMTQGSIAPLLLYIHSIEMGFAYQFFLSSLFLLHCALGLIYGKIFALRIKFLRNVWLISHIMIASLIMVLGLYHIYITYLYN